MTLAVVGNGGKPAPSCRSNGFAPSSSRSYYASLPLAAGGHHGPRRQCIEHTSGRWSRRTRARTALQLKIESCRVDVDACIRLCSTLLDDAQVFGSLTGCAVTFQDDEVHAP